MLWISRQDGNVYEALYREAQKSSLNATDPFDGYAELLRPQLDLDFLALRNRPAGELHMDEDDDDEATGVAAFAAEAERQKSKL